MMAGGLDRGEEVGVCNFHNFVAFKRNIDVSGTFDKDILKLTFITWHSIDIECVSVLFELFSLPPPLLV